MTTRTSSSAVERRRAQKRAYNRTSKGRARTARYNKSLKRQLCARRYSRTLKRQLCYKRYHQTPRYKEHNKWRMLSTRLRDKIRALAL